MSIPEKTYRDRRVLSDTVRHVGEGVAAVAVRIPALAEKAMQAVKVEYEPLPGLFDPFQAMAPDAVPIYQEIFLGGKKLAIENNIACHRQVGEGDVTKGFREADLVVEREFKTGRVYHAQMETKSVVCRPEADGGITVWPTAQSIHNTRQLLGRIFNIPLSRVNVHRVPIGGAFGSSIQMNTCIPICVALALKAQKPVKLVLSREEDMYDHCKYPSIIKLKYGGFHTSGTDAPTPGEVIDYSTAMVKVNEDGSVDFSTALMCHGGGTLEAGAKIVAEELGVPVDKVGISPSDTQSTGYDVCTHATRGIYCGGASIQR